MGGIGEVIQIDKSLFRGKPKHNRGRLLLGNHNNNNNNGNNNINDNNDNINNNDVKSPSSTSNDESDVNNDGAQPNNNRNYGRRIEDKHISALRKL